MFTSLVLSPAQLVQAQMCPPMALVDMLDPFSNAVCPPPRNIKAVKITGDTRYQTKIERDINALRNSDPTIRNYFDFVLNYLPKFNVLVANKYQYIGAQSKHENTPAHYEALTQTLQINADIIPKEGVFMYEALRHEMRHAYWHAMQVYSMGSNNINAYCFSPVNKTHRKKVSDAIKKGDERIARLKKILLKEKTATLSATDSRELKKLRRHVKPYQKYYAKERTLELPPNLPSDYYGKLIVGKTYVVPDDGGELVGEVKIVSKSHHPDAIRVIMLDPLRAMVYSIDYTKKLISSTYKKTQWEYEREAYLYGYMPPIFIQKFYPELVRYTDKLAAKPMAAPHPFEQYQAVGYASLKEYALNLRYIITSDKVAVDTMIKLDGSKQIIKALRSAIEQHKYYYIGYDKIRDILHYMIRKGKEVKEANLLMARIADQENDGLTACRFYHRAFKQGADFTIDEITSCLTRLIKEGELGEANVICRKSVQRYQYAYEKIPESYLQSRASFYENYLVPLLDLQQQIRNKRNVRP